MDGRDVWGVIGMCAWAKPIFRLKVSKRQRNLKLIKSYQNKLKPIPISKNMLLGLVGKPSSGKSTFFKAATMSDVLIFYYLITYICQTNKYQQNSNKNFVAFSIELQVRTSYMLRHILKEQICSKM